MATTPSDKLNPETFAKEPAIRVSYDAVRQVQRLAFRGMLIDSKKAQLKTDFLSPIVAALLDAVQKQAKDFVKKHLEKATVGAQPSGFLDPADYDLLFTPVPTGLTDTQKQDEIRKKRGKLANAFLPFLQQQLIRQLTVQTLAADLTADPALTEALLTSLLNDPSQSDKPLLDAFTVAGESGISAAFFASADGTGTPLATKTVTSVDTTGKPTGANSASFEGYFEVLAAGAYRFFFVFGKKDAEAELHLAHLPDPLLRGKAANDGDEISQFTELKPGVPYRFTFDTRNLSGGDVALLVQGENFPKDSLARLTLYPQAAVERVRRARMLLAKTLQLIQGLGLSEREVRYLLTHGADFDNLDLSKLPTQEADDSSAGATMLFGQFLRLVDYSRLKQDLSGGTDDFVGIFENARRTYPTSADAIQAKSSLFEDLCKRFADITRRDGATVRATTQHLGFTAQSSLTGNELQVKAVDFAQEKGIWRLWEVLQIVETFGISVEAIARSTEIVSGTKTPEERFGIARDLRNTVKARYGPENWQRIAQSIFDKLRQRQRDALVAYIMHRHGFERMEQLFEYFLIDPGMEPVVQTSRIRLAISSVQLFIQRCLLNLEPQVHPSVINSKHWQWMKRYRVWEANRKIFLFPENWLEPEFRDDKTHLFRELESALLQGDVSNDLVEDAFFDYLKKLEELARLDVVAMYCEEKALDPVSNTLHVIGRTFNQPHKYFYRRYAHQMWTSWEPVTAEIEGDHLAAVVWRERLHLFWVTFLEKPKQDTDPASAAADTELATVKLKTTITQVADAARWKVVEVQLNWSEYFQGQWTTRESSGFANPISVQVPSSFDNRQVFIYVYKEYDSGEERAVGINLTGTINGAFRVVNKHSPPRPDPDNNVYLLGVPYPNTNRQATRYTGSNALRVNFVERIETEEDNLPKVTSDTKEILRQENNFSLITCNDVLAVDFETLIKSFPPKEIGTTPYELRIAERRASAVKAYLVSIGIAASRLDWVPLSAWDQLFQWIINVAPTRTLPNPFFYQDHEHTFFVEPTLTETTVDQWETWVVPTPLPDPKFDDDDWWKPIPIEPMVPKQPFPIDPIGPIARFKIGPKEDWVINPATVFQFDGRLVGQGGGIDVAVLPAAIGAGEVGTPVHVTPGGELVPGGILVTPGGRESMPGSLMVTAGGLNIVGGGGLNAVMRESLNVRRGLNPALLSDGITGRSFNR